MLIKRDPAFFTGVTSELPVRLTRSPPSPAAPLVVPARRAGSVASPYQPHDGRGLICMFSVIAEELMITEKKMYCPSYTLLTSRYTRNTVIGVTCRCAGMRTCQRRGH